MSVSSSTDRAAKIPPIQNSIVCDNDDQSKSGTSESKTTTENNTEIEEITFVDDCEEDLVPKYILRMLNLANEIAIFCVLLIAYTALTSETPKVTKPPVAYRFFPKESYVRDYYRGELGLAVEHARYWDVTFVMFYAPWDARSQAARQEFELAAEYMHQHVFFAAVNCWHPSGECKTHFNKVYSWPTLIVYPTFGRGIQYRGPLKHIYLINFLQKMVKPVKRIGKTIDVIDYQDAFVTVELNTLPGSIPYGIYYAAAQKYLETDPYGRIAFYVKPVTNSTLILHLHLWNQEMISDEFTEIDWRIDTILKWIQQNMDKITGWVSPRGVKSLLLSGHLQTAPTLILFTPRNPLRSSVDYYDMLREIAQDYKNCNDLIYKFDVMTKRLRNLLEHSQLEKSCNSETSSKTKKLISSFVTTKFWGNLTDCDTKREGLLGHRNECSSFGNILTNLKSDYCQEILPKSSDCKTDQNFVPKDDSKDVLTYFGTSMLKTEHDPLSMENLAKIHRKEQCKQFDAAQKYQPAIFENIRNRKEPNIAGLSCNKNNSLNFIAIDSLMHYHFAERLGIDVSKSRYKSGAVIVDSKMETHYILTEPITSKSLRQFIVNFSKNQLQRSLNSSTSMHSKNTHNYPIIRNKKGNKSSSSLPVVFVEELNTNNFLSTVLQEPKAVLVMYYSKQCSFCNGISYTYLTLSKKVSQMQNYLKFTRIDGELNLLPWEYTMDTFPTILLFPAASKSESRVFPQNLPITLTNLIGFLLANVDQKLRLQIMYHLCNSAQRKLEKQSCFSSLRGETLTLINSTLKSWRKSNKRQKQVQLHNLTQLKQLHLLFGCQTSSTSTRDHSQIDSYFTKLHHSLDSMRDYYVGDTDAQVHNNNTKDEL